MPSALSFLLEVALAIGFDFCLTHDSARWKTQVRLIHNLVALFACVNIRGIDDEGMKQDRVIGILGLGWFHLLRRDEQPPRHRRRSASGRYMQGNWCG